MTELDYSIDGFSSKPPRIAHILRITLVVLSLAVAAAFVTCLGFIAATLMGGSMKTELMDMVNKYHPSVQAVNPQAVQIMALAGAVWAAFAGFILWMVFKICSSLMTGDPFHPDNLKWLKRIWVALLIFEISMIFIRPYLETVAGTGQINLYQFGMSFKLAHWFFIVVIAALTAVFHHGVRLRHEQQLTV